MIWCFLLVAAGDPGYSYPPREPNRRDLWLSSMRRKRSIREARSGAERQRGLLFLGRWRRGIFTQVTLLWKKNSNYFWVIQQLVCMWLQKAKLFAPLCALVFRILSFKHIRTKICLKYDFFGFIRIEVSLDPRASWPTTLPTSFTRDAEERLERPVPRIKNQSPPPVYMRTVDHCCWSLTLQLQLQLRTGCSIRR